VSGWGAAALTGRRQRKDARDDRRRTAYITFIAAGEELRRLMVAHTTMEKPPTPDSTFGENLSAAVGAVDRAYIPVDLAAPKKVRTAALEAQQSAWGLYAWVYDQKNPGPTTPGEVGALVGKYIGDLDAFVVSVRD
jgi:hypothetical protein